MFNIEQRDFKDIKIVLERIEGDNKNLKATILWKQDLRVRESGNFSVYVEVRGEKYQSCKLEKHEVFDIWYADLKIRNSFCEIASLNNKLAVKLIEYKKLPYNISCSYVF